MRTLKPVIVFALVSTLCVLRSLTAEEKLDLPGEKVPALAESIPAVRVYPWESPGNASIRSKLKKVSPEVHFDGVSLEQCLSFFQDVWQLNVVVNWTALETEVVGRDKEITLMLQGATGANVLGLILEQAGGGETDLAYEIMDNYIGISTREDLARRTFVVIYNVKDLLELGAQRTLGADASYYSYCLVRLIELIQQTVDPESWREAGGNVGAISDYSDLIIVTQTSGAHEQIWGLLENMRAALRQ